MDSRFVSDRCVRNSRVRIAEQWLAVLVVLVGGCTATSGGKRAEPTRESKTPVVFDFGAHEIGANQPDSQMSKPAPLAVPGQEGRETCQIYLLRSQSPSQLADVLNGLIYGMDEEDEDDAEESSSADEERIVILPEETTRSLIVRADPANQERIARLIHRLDTQPQIMIDCTLVEVTKKFDFLLFKLHTLAQAPYSLRKSSATETEPNTFDVSSRQGPLFCSDQQINALVTDMWSQGYGRVLGKPRLCVPNHRTGVTETKETIYVKGNSACYNPYESGLDVSVTPHVGEGDMVQLDIAISISAFAATGSSAPPRTQTSKLDAAVTLPAGRTVIFGGMSRVNKNKSKVPLLGDLPLLGGLFRRGDDEDATSAVYLFIKAEIVRLPEGSGVGPNG